MSKSTQVDFNSITKGKCIPLGILTILIFYIMGFGSTSTIYSFMFLTAIFIGYMKDYSQLNALIAGLLTTVIGGIIIAIINVALIYVSYGQTYASYMISMELPVILLCSMAVGIIGGLIGYYVSCEIKANNAIEETQQ